MYAPKGVAALYRRREIELEPIMYGGPQEFGTRPGTENVAFAVALPAACEMAGEICLEAGRLRLLRDTLFDALSAALRRRVVLNGHPTQRLPNMVNVSIEGIDGQQLLWASREIAASTQSACHSASDKPSGVLTAMGNPADRARGALRLSLGRTTGGDDVRRGVYLLSHAVNTVSS